MLAQFLTKRAIVRWPESVMHQCLRISVLQCTGTKATASAPQEEEKPACWRWLLVIIAMPVLAILTVVGIVLWLILLPIKIVCCPIGEVPSPGSTCLNLLQKQSENVRRQVSTSFFNCLDARTSASVGQGADVRFLLPLKIAVI